MAEYGLTLGELLQNLGLLLGDAFQNGVNAFDGLVSWGRDLFGAGEAGVEAALRELPNILNQAMADLSYAIGDLIRAIGTRG